MTGLGELAAELLDELDEQYPGAEVGTVMVIVELQQAETTTIHYRSNDKRQWIQRALLREATELADQEDDDTEWGNNT